MAEGNKKNENNQIDNDDDDNNFSLFRDSNEIKNENSSKTVINHRNKRSQNHQLYESIHSSSRKINNFEMPIKNNINKNINKNKIDEDLKIIKEKEEEEKKKIELKEKENNKIRDKLKCFICFGKVINATMCIKCKGIACEECVKKMI